MYPELIKELLQVGPGSLGSSSNGHCSAVWVNSIMSFKLAFRLIHTIVVGAGTSLEDVRSLVVIACYEEANSIWSLAISLKQKINEFSNCLLYNGT